MVVSWRELTGGRERKGGWMSEWVMDIEQGKTVLMLMVLYSLILFCLLARDFWSTNLSRCFRHLVDVDSIMGA